MIDQTNLQSAVGMLWTNVQIPAGVFITRAYIRFTADETGSNPASLRFSGEASDDALPFTTASFDISSRPRTVRSVDWANIPSWNTVGESGLAQQTADLSPIIQEIIDRSGWAVGNNIVIIVESLSSNGPRVAESLDGIPGGQAPLLHIEYTTDVPPPPTSTIPDFKVAFVGDLFLNDGTRDLYQLIKEEGAEMLLLLGDLDHADDPEAWEQQIDDILGPDFPVFAAIGNHEIDNPGEPLFYAPNGYQQRLMARRFRLEQIEGKQICTGDLGVKSACNYKGLFFILSGIGTVPFIDQRIASSSDDAEENVSGTVSVTSSDLDMMLNGGAVQKAVGMRWTNVQIPKGAIITRATIRFTAKATGVNPADIRFRGQAADNAPPFTTASNSISSRPTTTTFVDWVNIPPWNAGEQEGEAQQTPNLPSIIQQIVNRPGWAPGNSIAIIATKRSSTSPNGPRTAVSFNNNPTQAPRLHVEYYTIDNEYISYINNQFAEDNSLWRVCAWHRAQRLMQVGPFGDGTGWGVYEACRQGGAIVGTAHDTTYARTHLMSNFEDQSVASTANTLVLEKGKSFTFVNGLGGGGIGQQFLNGGWWASIYASTCLSSSTVCQPNATYGALFCTFNVNGQPDLANCYFRDINGNIIDDFDVISDVQLVP
jgi:hypothetical protein